MYHFPDEHSEHGDVEYTEFKLEGEAEKNFFHLNMNPFFEMMDQMEEAFGKPQYFEWAMTIDNGIPKYWILQIADIDKRLDHFDLKTMESRYL